ncbi:hypothetical protein ACH5RR_015232 [Cinchona calisaya]|uniref:Strictosidine synthase conserved region domain-containing protein n=1 Tax=Cinchona calisaya TaxID=153742 RepID=A0ABD2ZTR6_9GENT
MRSGRRERGMGQRRRRGRVGDERKRMRLGKRKKGSGSRQLGKEGWGCEKEGERWMTKGGDDAGEEKSKRNRKSITITPEKNITLTSFTKLPLPSTVASPESLAFDFLGEGPYTGVSDGRILKYIRLTESFIDFAYTSPNRTRAFCDGTTSLDKSPICGLPLGLGFNYFTGNLYSCDPFIGLTSVGPFGGLATTLVPTQDGVPYRFLIAVDVDTNGIVSFTDASAIYGPKDVEKSIQSGDSTGRVLRYDPKSKTVTTLLSQLSGAVGVATSSDASFLLVSEFIAKRVRRLAQRRESRHF